METDPANQIEKSFGTSFKSHSNFSLKVINPTFFHLYIEKLS